MEEEYIIANGIQFHLLTSGPISGHLVLLLHGFPENAYSWKRQLDVLGRVGFRVWAPDLRGYDLSQKPQGVRNYHLLTLARDVRELIRAAGAESAVVVGHDWGALIAWRFAMEYPEALSKLVIMNVPHPAKYFENFSLWQLLKSWYIFFFQIPWLPEFLFSHNARRVAEGIRRSAVRREAFSDEDIERYAKAIAQPGAMHAAINYYRALVRWGWRLPVKPIHAPTLMIWGENDVALEKSLTYGTEKYVSDLRLHYIPHSGHWVQQEAADEVNHLVLGFLSEQP